MNLKKLVTLIDCSIYNPLNLSEDFEILDIKPLELADENTVSFFTNKKAYQNLFLTKACAVILKEPEESLKIVQLISKHPEGSMAKASMLFYNYKHGHEGQSSSAQVHESAKIHSSVVLYPGCHVAANVNIAENTVIYPFVYIGENATIGKDCIIYPNVTLMHNIVLGDRCVIHAGSVIGADGFGFIPSRQGMLKIAQKGNVVLEDDVEVGAVTSIDRATFASTRIGRGTKIDSHVHVGHNVTIGENSLLCGQVGIAGSAKIGKNFIAAGKAGVTQGAEITDNVILGAKTGVTGDIIEPGEYLGMPHMNSKEWKRQVVYLKNLPQLAKKVRELEEMLKKLVD